RESVLLRPAADIGIGHVPRHFGHVPDQGGRRCAARGHPVGAALLRRSGRRHRDAPVSLRADHRGVTDVSDNGATDPDHLAALLHRARSGRTLLDAARAATDLSLDDAYPVQDRLTALRLAEGRSHIGWKLGYTSAVMRQQMGVSAPNYGPLLDDMR